MEFALAIVAMLFWAVGMVLAKPGLARMDVIAYGFIRPIFASFLVLAYAIVTHSLFFPSAGTVLMAVLGGFVDMFIGVSLFLYAMRRVSAHEVGTLSNTAPFWGVVISVVWLREQPEVATFVAAALGAGISWGVADTAIAKYCLAQGLPRPTLHLVYMLSAGTCWGILAAVKGRLALRYYAWHGLKIALLSAFCAMFAGMLLWLLALEHAPASVLAPTRGALTLFVFILSVLALREKPSRRSGVGVALVTAGVVIASLFA